MKAKLSLLFILLITALLSAQDTGRVYMFVPQMPSFQGKLDNYLAEHVQYPKRVQSNGIMGTVNVTFIISQTGEISEVSVLTSVSPDIDSEAVRVVRAMPPWNPGMKDGKPVRVQFNLPVYIGPNSSNGETVPTQRYKPRDTIMILRDGLYIDPYIGIGEGGLSSSTPTSVKTGINMKFGVEASYVFPSNIGVSVGLQVKQFKFSYSSNSVVDPSSYNGTYTTTRSKANDTTVTAGYADSMNYSFTYLQIPLLCRYITSHENKIGFYAEAGLIVNYLINSQITGNFTQTQYQLYQAPNTYWYMYSGTYPANPTPVSMASQNPSRLTIDLHLGAGVLIPVTGKMSIILDVAPDVGLMNAGDGSKDAVSFGTSNFYFFGKGKYGSFNSYLFDTKFLIKLSGSSRVVHIN